MMPLCVCGGGGGMYKVCQVLQKVLIGYFLVLTSSCICRQLGK